MSPSQLAGQQLPTKKKARDISERLLLDLFTDSYSFDLVSWDSTCDFWEFLVFPGTKIEDKPRQADKSQKHTSRKQVENTAKSKTRRCDWLLSLSDFVLDFPGVRFTF